MHPTSFRSILGAACLAAAVITPKAATGQIQRLERVGAAFPEPFTSVSGLRELSDGRILIADRTEKHVSFLDFATGSMREIGRIGEGPGEYQSPGGLVALPDDYTLLLDMANLRLTRIAPDGKLEMESWPMMNANGLIRPSAADAQGRLFYSASGGMRIASGGGAASTPPDSLPIIRWDPATDVTDTVGMFYSPSATSRGGGSISFNSGRSRVSLAGFRQQPFSPRDAWAAVPDGGVAVVRATTYRMDWYRNGVSTAGPAIEYEPIRINQAEKEAWADRQANQTATFMMIGGGGGGRGGGGTFEMPRPDIDEIEFPDYKPPFPVSGVRATPDGQVWVQRYQRHSEDRVLFDVFNDRGELVKQVQLPAGRRLVGFGDGVLYAVMTDEDDLEWLERYGR